MFKHMWVILAIVMCAASPLAGQIVVGEDKIFIRFTNLRSDDALIQIRSKDRRPPPLVFESNTKRDFVKYGNLIGIPLLLVMFASLRLLRRRRQTGQSYQPSVGGAVS